MRAEVEPYGSPGGSPRGRWARELGAMLAGVAGCLVFYMAVGGAVSFLVRRPYGVIGSCVPYHDVYGFIESHCSVAAVNMFWFGTVAIPRFLLVFPAVAIAVAKAAAHGHGSIRDAAIWLVYSIPLVLVLWVGVRYWLGFGLRGYRIAVWIALAVIVADILALGLTE